MTDDEREFNIRSTPHGDDVAFLLRLLDEERARWNDLVISLPSEAEIADRARNA
jgi:hypothetical protein